MSWRERWNQDGGGRELLHLAWPLVLSNSFLALQITIDRVMLSWWSSDAVAAAMAAVVVFWTPMALLQNVANYATTFVSQYVGAERPQRVGPALWQSLHFSWVTGILFLGLLPFSGWLMGLGGHSPAVLSLEEGYFTCLCHCALPMLLVASVGSFFAGRGDSWTVMWINAVGLLVNGLLDYAWISGHWGFPEWGIEGAGWATVAGSWASAIVGLALVLRPKYEAVYRVLSGWRFDWDLSARLLRFGFPAGLQWMFDVLAFNFFIMLVGRLGDAELAATSIAFTINMVAVVPMMGIGQAVSVLVGQRLGQDKPELAERSTWTGFWMAWTYMSAMAVLYAAAPGMFVVLFASDDVERWPAVAGLVPILLRFVAVYSLFDSMNMVFSFALRGAGDTRFVTFVLIGLSWPLMVFPAWASWYYGWGLYWAWAFASLYVVALGFSFMLRFRYGKWKTMRVIEAAPPPANPAEGDGAETPQAALDHPPMAVCSESVG